MQLLEELAELAEHAAGPDGETVTAELDLDEAAAMAGEAAEALDATFQNLADSVHVEGDPGKFTTSFSLGEAGPGEDDPEVEVMLSPAQALNLFRFIVLFLVFSQVGLMVWKRRRPKSYAYVTVTALWAVRRVAAEAAPGAGRGGSDTDAARGRRRCPPSSASRAGSGGSCWCGRRTRGTR